MSGNHLDTLLKKRALVLAQLQQDAESIELLNARVARFNEFRKKIEVIDEMLAEAGHVGELEAAPVRPGTFMVRRVRPLVVDGK